MTTRKTLEGPLADWHPHPRESHSLAPVVSDAGIADEIADRFFESAPDRLPPEPPIVAEPPPRQVAIDSAAVRARRRYLMRYVAGAVTVASAIVLAAVVRVTTSSEARAAAAPLHIAAAFAASLPAFAEAPASASDPAFAEAPASASDPAFAEAPASASDPVVGDPAPANAAVASPAEQDPPADSTPIAEPSTRAAADAKSDAQRALERGLLADAVEAGEESVALDPTDADAWLVLGAAYEKRGRYADARRCFQTCAEQARRGGRWECRALLR
jgi:Flp pilus assembly protein TadD